MMFKQRDDYLGRGFYKRIQRLSNSKLAPLD